MLLDTHAVVFLHAGESGRFSATGKRLIEAESLYVGPMAILELQYLYEIQRISVPAEQIISELSFEIGLRVLERDWYSVARKACELNWTRDPFDRFITAQALVEGQRLLTRDRQVLEMCSVAIW